jgi:hypothetical protein
MSEIASGASQIAWTAEQHLPIVCLKEYSD